MHKKTPPTGGVKFDRQVKKINTGSIDLCRMTAQKMVEIYRTRNSSLQTQHRNTRLNDSKENQVVKACFAGMNIEFLSHLSNG
ncbi:hypothetical protein [Vibrio salinus]|uniref:hypothetical protein n=1 Tax=Vibrio salinus TaxID=2899784 RepID=UPI001E4C76A9|nr:hypothetical protein [Vibrio salinus]MCE0493053.1 hypothetical protein [Vibrio salinus]